jgi:hypothetical protein
MVVVVEREIKHRAQECKKNKGLRELWGGLVVLHQYLVSTLRLQLNILGSELGNHVERGLSRILRFLIKHTYVV